MSFKFKLSSLLEPVGLLLAYKLLKVDLISDGIPAPHKSTVATSAFSLVHLSYFIVFSSYVH